MGLDSLPVTKPKDEVAADPSMPDDNTVAAAEEQAKEMEINLMEVESPTM